jgi:hypothetical protein
MINKQDGHMITFAIIIIIVCIIGLCLTSGHHHAAQKLSDAVDYVLFDNPEQVEIYKEVVK